MQRPAPDNSKDKLFFRQPLVKRNIKFLPLHFASQKVLKMKRPERKEEREGGKRGKEKGKKGRTQAILECHGCAWSFQQNYKLHQAQSTLNVFYFLTQCSTPLWAWSRHSIKTRWIFFFKQKDNLEKVQKRTTGMIKEMNERSQWKG